MTAKYFITALLLVLASDTAVFGMGLAPLVIVPKTGKQPVIDGRMSPGEWPECGRISGFMITGKDKPCAYPVSVRLAYDDASLYALFAVPRVGTNLYGASGLKDDYIWNSSDDVGICIDAKRTRRDYLEMIVNHAGSTFDAKNMDKAYDFDWQVKTSASPDYWYAEFAVPFKSLEAAAPNVGDRLGANFIWDRAGRWSGELSDWAGSGMWFQMADKFGTLVFGDEAGKVPVSEAFNMVVKADYLHNKADIYLDSSIAASISASNTATRNGAFAAFGSPSSAGLGEVRANVFVRDASGKIIGKPVSVTLTDGKGRTDIAFPSKAQRIAVIAIYNSNGKEIGRTVEEIDLHGRPDWLNTRAGVSDKLLPGFTAVKASKNDISCWGRTYSYGSAPLPGKIVAKGRQILAAPVAIGGSVNGKPLVWRSVSGKVVKSAPNLAVYDASAKSGKIDLSTRSTVEYDGCVKVEVTMRAAAGQKADALYLEIPIRAEYAKYMHVANGIWADSWSGSVDDAQWKWNHAFMPYVWFGDEWRGLAWFSETDEPCNLIDRGTALEARRDGNRMIFRINILDHEDDLPREIKWTFGLQATPVKPVRRMPAIYHGVDYGYEKKAAQDQPDKLLFDRLKDEGFEYIHFHQQWPRFYGYPSTPYKAEMKSLASAIHQRGMKLRLYFGYGMAQTSPEMKSYYEDWAIKPLMPWSHPEYVPDQWMYATCAKSTASDFVLHEVGKTLDDFGIDGMYFDGTTVPLPCSNAAHGCGYEKDGVRYPTYPVWAVREYVKRLITVMRQRRPDAWVDVHMSASLTMPTVSFCDGYLDGEQYMGIRESDRKVDELMPLDKFRAEFMGKQYGLQAEFLCMPAFKDEEGLAISLLHDQVMRGMFPSQIPKVTAVRHVLQDYDTFTADWLPYWEQKAVKSSDPRVLISAYTKPGRGALLIASNMGFDKVRSQLTLDLPALKLSAGLSQAVDPLSGNIYAISGNKLDVELGSLNFVILIAE